MQSKDKETEDETSSPVNYSGISLKDIEDIVDRKLIERDVRQGHMSPEDGAAALDALKGGKS